MNLLKQTKVQLLIVAVLTVLVYLNSLSNQLVWDDHLFLEQWPQIRSLDNFQEIFQGSAPPEQGKIFRPLRGVFWAIDYQIFGVNPLGYRIQAILIHLASTILVYGIARETIQGLGVRVWGLGLKIKATEKLSIPYTLYPIPFVTALLFGLHPIHTETIDYISTSMETWGSLFFFLSFYLYLLAKNTSKVKKTGLHLRGGLYAGSVLSAFIAFFTYEMTLTLPLLLVGYELIVQSSKFKVQNYNNIRVSRTKLKIFEKKSPLFYALRFKLLVLIPYFLAALAFISIRVFLLGVVSRTDYLGYSFYHTMLTMVKVFASYILLLFFPFNQTAIHNLVGEFPSSMIPYDSLEPILSQTIFDKDVILAIALHIFLIAVAIRILKNHKLISFSIFWFYISLLPVSYIIPHGGAMAEKYLYIASFGFVFVISYLLLVISNLFKSNKNNITIITVITIILVYSGFTILRNAVWANDITLFSDVVKKSPNNLLANYNLGIWYGLSGQLEASQAHYQKALVKAPNFWEARYNLGNINLRRLELEKAKEEYFQVLNINPKFTSAKNILDNFHLIEQATKSATVSQDSVFVPYKLRSGLTFTFPLHWSLVLSTQKITNSYKTVDGALLKDPSGNFQVEIQEDRVFSKEKYKDYIDQKDTYIGELANQGLAQIPNMDYAWVKVFSDKGIVKLRFFLFKGLKVAKVVVSPADSALMREFDIILGSIKLE